MTDKRYAQVLLYNSFGHFDKRDWKPKSHQEIEDAEAWADGRFTQEDLLAILNGEATEIQSPVPEPEKPKVETPPSETTTQQPSKANRLQVKTEPTEVHEGQIIPFPVEALEDTIFGIYEQAYAGKNETCPAFRFAELATAIGARLGRSICYRPHHAPHADDAKINDSAFWEWYNESNYDLYPNFYSCLWGEPAESKKSTSVKKTRKLKIWDDDLLTMNSLSTREGIIGSLKAQEEETSQPPRLLILYDELAGLFSKARQQNSETLITTLNEGYYCPSRMDNNSQEAIKENNTSVEDVSFSFIGGITPYWLKDKMTMEELGSGFASRFMYFQHESQQPRPEPLSPDPNLLYEIYTKLKNLDPTRPKRFFQFDDEARELHKDWYTNNKANTPSNIAVKWARQRLEEYAIKTALQVAYFKKTSTNDNTITIDDFAVGISLADYWEKVIKSIFSEFTDNDRIAKQRKVIVALQKLGGHDVERSKILPKITSPRPTAEELTNILRSLEANGFILIRGERPQIVSVIDVDLYEL